MNTLDEPLRRSLRALIGVGKMTRAGSDYFSADGKVRIPADIARRLKQRGYAVPGFNGDMVATERGRKEAGPIPLALRTEFEDPGEVTMVYADHTDEFNRGKDHARETTS